MEFAKSRLDFFYANGIGGDNSARVPNLVALKNINADTPQGGVIFAEGSEFYLPLPFGSTKITAIGAEPIILGENARVLTDAEVLAWKTKNAMGVGTDLAQDVADKALNEEGLVRKSNIAWWLLGGVVVYLVFFKK